MRSGRAGLGVLLCIAVFVDYKVAGTGHPFSSIPGDLDPLYPRGQFPGVSRSAFDLMRLDPDYRAAVNGVHPTDLRRYGLGTPQGFDPLFSRQYKAFIERYQPFHTNRLFDLPPGDLGLLEKLGVKYYLVQSGTPSEAQLSADPNFRLVGSRDFFIAVYEYMGAKPSWRWDGFGHASTARWLPEVREFAVQAKSGGRLVLLEQFYPGWQGTVDGRIARIDLFEGVFQAIEVPAGSHVVRFEYHAAGLVPGAAISAAIWSLLGVFVWRHRPSR